MPSNRTITIKLNTKTYIKHFLVSNYGNPVQLSNDRDLYNNLRRRLCKKSFRFEKRGLSKSMYCEQVDIVISEDDFYRYGWELSITDIIALNRDIEAMVKFFMRSIVSTYQTIMHQKEAIQLFQERFGFTEDIWSYEAIKKDYYRNSNHNIKVKLLPDLSLNLEKIILVHLSDLGTIVQPKNLHYENHLQEL